jgi:hypothetical protein
LENIPITISSAEDYFEHVLSLNYRDFFEQPSTFQTAVNLASSLYHFHEWIYHYRRAFVEHKFSTAFSTARDFWSYLEKHDGEFGYLRDIANASKHVEIDRNPSTGMTHFANTHITWTGFGLGAYGAGRFGGGPNISIDDGGKNVSFDSCAQKLFKFWDALIKEAGASGPG